MAVIAAVELHDDVATRGAAGQPDGAHRGLGPRADQPQHLHRGKGGVDGLGQLDLHGRGRAVARPPAGRLGHRLHDHRRRVAQDERPPRADEVDVAPAVHVVQPRALGARHEERLTSHPPERAHRAVHPARDAASAARSNRLDSVMVLGPDSPPIPHVRRAPGDPGRSSDLVMRALLCSVMLGLLGLGVQIHPPTPHVRRAPGDPGRSSVLRPSTSCIAAVIKQGQLDSGEIARAGSQAKPAVSSTRARSRRPAPRPRRRWPPDTWARSPRGPGADPSPRSRHRRRCASDR